jgi:small-conductance mechanosensitive channel
MQQWLGEDWRPQAITWLVTKPLALLGLVVVALAARWFLHRLIDRIVRRAAEGLPNPILAGPSLWRHRGEDHEQEAEGGPTSTGSTRVEPPPLLGSGRRVQRAETMGSLLKSVTSVVIVTVFVITAIAELGYPVGPLLASAGVVGVALGFGAQSLVKDFLSGIFMIFEDQYGVGDVVDLGEATGTVEAVGLRVTRLRDVQGTVWYVRNGEILRVGNQSQNWARTVLDIPVALDQDLHRVQDVLRDVAHDLWDDEDFASLIIEEPEVWGVQELTPNWVVVRVTMKTAPLEQWAVAREMRQRVKIRFDHEGIELAHPTVAPWTG